MASQQPPVRPWFRLGSMARPPTAPTPTPTPEADQLQPPPAPVARPIFLRPAYGQPFRPPVPQPQPTQPQMPATVTPPPPLPAFAARPPTTAPLPPAAASPPLTMTLPPPATIPPQPPTAAAPPPPRIAAPSPPSPAAPLPPATTTSSVPSSPILRSSTSLPTSPAPKALPQTTTILPAASSSVPPSPKLKFSAPSSSLTTSPARKPELPTPAAPPPSPIPAAIAPTTTIAAREAFLVSSPKIVKPLDKTPQQSPKITPVSHPPSPLTLPPAKLRPNAEREPKIPVEAEQKTVLVQETIEKPKVIPKSSNGDSQRYVSQTFKSSNGHNGKPKAAKDVPIKDKGKKFSDSEGSGMSVITIAGENKGAIMELSPSRKKHDFGKNSNGVHAKTSLRGWSDGEISGGDKGGSYEGGGRKMKEKSTNSSILQSPPTTEFVNSNVQGVNNSIIYNSSCAHHDPGVHLYLIRKANGGRGSHLRNCADG